MGAKETPLFLLRFYFVLSVSCVYQSYSLCFSFLLRGFLKRRKGRMVGGLIGIYYG